MKKIYIDGVWGLGKSILCKRIAERQSFTYIDEPVFPIKISKVNFDDEIIDKWYLNAHLGNAMLADEIPNDVVLERSMVSTLVYQEHYQKNIENRQSFIERYLKLNFHSIFILLDFDYPDFLAVKDQFRDYRKPLINGHLGLIKEYEKRFSGIMASSFPNLKYYKIKTLDQSGYIDTEVIYKNIVSFL